MLEIQNLSRTFFPGTVNERKALRNINLKLNNGDFVTVIGSNGAGKSTLLHMTGGRLRPDAGKVASRLRSPAFVAAACSALFPIRTVHSSAARSKPLSSASRTA